MINSLFFTGKIPIAKCEIYDKTEKKLVPATVYEYDGKDLSDLEDFKDATLQTTPFRSHVLNTLEDKCNEPELNKEEHIYTIETFDGKIAANAHTQEKEENEMQIIQIGSSKHQYGMAAKKLVAAMGKDALNYNKDNKLTVFAPNPDAIPFYTQTCKFKFANNYQTLYLDNDAIEALSEQSDIKAIDYNA